ncbi:c-type cytochrome [Duganella fentianensis]|nr:c-type cytochrome [Duganella fentianensis]
MHRKKTAIPVKRKWSWLVYGLFAAALIVGVMYGPNLYALLRISNEIDTISREATQAAGPWPRASDACIYCHDGMQGNARTQLYPRLAGQPAAYLKKQLTGFANGERHDPTMTPFALGLSEQDMDTMVSRFAKMTPRPNMTFHADAVKVARGEALVKSGNCVACHGQKLEGRDTYPRLAGQSYDYLVDQLTNFKSGVRHDASGAMPAIAANLSSGDIEDLGHFLASR